MAKIACLLADGFEDSEYRVPVDRLRQGGHEVVVLGSGAGDKVSGKQGEEEVELDDAIAEHSPDEFDALLIPGGYSPDHLRLNQDAIDFTKKFSDTGKPVAAVCHGPQILISAGVVEGRRMTSWPSVRVDRANAGARWIDEPVVTDAQFITSRKPDDLEDFSAALMERL